MMLILELSLSFAVGLLGALLIYKVGFRLGLADVPGARSSHDRPIPKGGGIGIPLAVALSSFCLVRSGQGFVILALAMAAMAFINDRFEVSVGLRLALGFVLSAALVLLRKREAISALFAEQGIIAVLAVGLLFTVYVLAVTNVFNFMDGINGLAGVEAVVSLVGLGLAAGLMKSSREIVSLAFSGAAAAAGFLVLNFPRAKVFMGDVGSIFIGYFFAGLTVLLAKNAKELLFLALFQGIFIVDGFSTLLVRLLNGENILRAHKKHLYQKLVHQAGWTHRRVTLVYGSCQALIGLTAALLYPAGTLLLAIFWAIVFALYWSILLRKNFLFV